MPLRSTSVILFACLALGVGAPKGLQGGEPSTRTDLYGDPLPLGAIARLGTVRWRPQQGVFRMAFVPGGKYLATNGGSELSVWDLDSGRVVRTISAGDDSFGAYQEQFVFSPDGKYLLS